MDMKSRTAPSLLNSAKTVLDMDKRTSLTAKGVHIFKSMQHIRRLSLMARDFEQLKNGEKRQRD